MMNRLNLWFKNLWKRTVEVATLYTGTFIVVMILNQLLFFGFCLNPVCLIAAMPHVLFITVIVGTWWNNHNGWGKKSAKLLEKSVEGAEALEKGAIKLEQWTADLERDTRSFADEARVERERRIKELKDKLRGGENNLLEQKHPSKFDSYLVTSLWHLTHKDNIRSILQQGLKSHSKVYEGNSLGTVVDISDHSVQRWRVGPENLYDRKLHDYVPLYICAKNPMLYRLRNMNEGLCLIEVSLGCLEYVDVVLSDGNAASKATKFYKYPDGLTQLPWNVLRDDYWTNYDDGKRKRCSEVLVYPEVTSKNFIRVHCYSDETCRFLHASLGDHELDIVVSPHLFFE